VTPEDHVVIIERLTRVEEKLDSLLDKTSTTHTRLDAHEDRIRSLETSGAKLFGMGAAGSLIAGVAGTQIFEKLFG
jgi:hypothetical protein